MAEQAVGLVVVGLPVGLSGRGGTRRRVRRAHSPTRLRTRVPVPVETYDERFTTKLARRTSGRPAEDSRAAAHLLESYLERSREVATG